MNERFSQHGCREIVNQEQDSEHECSFLRMVRKRQMGNRGLLSRKHRSTVYIYIYSGLQISRNGIGETGRAAWMTHERHSNIVLESKRSKAGERSVPWYSIHGHVCQSHDTLASSTPGSSVICAILFGSERSLTSMDFSPYTIFCLFVSQLNLILLTYLDMGTDISSFLYESPLVNSLPNIFIRYI